MYYDGPPPASAGEEQALEFLVELLRKGEPLSPRGYDVSLDIVIREFIHEIGGVPRNLKPRPELGEVQSPAFLGAAWSLCRLGVLRPGVTVLGVGETTGYNKGYSITEFGRQWIKESNEPLLIPTDAGRTTKMLLGVGSEFGNAYAIRCKEAARCYIVHAYFACCAMVGAAAEAILLAAASRKLGEEKAVAIYRSGTGRSRLLTPLLGHHPEWLRRGFANHTNLVAYWRDQASHGHSTAITESEADMALRGLLQFGIFANEHWGELTDPPA